MSLGLEAEAARRLAVGTLYGAGMLAQASDGDSFGADSSDSAAYMVSKLLPFSRYFVYAEVGEKNSPGTTRLWAAYQDIASDHFNMATVGGRDEVYPALAKLFQREQPA